MEHNTQSTSRQGIHLLGGAIERIGFGFREQPIRDDGIDAHAEWYPSGVPSGQLIAIQNKAGPSWLKEKENGHFVFRFERRHKDLWINHALPALVCLGDLESSTIYWQVVDHDTVINTGQNFKILVPKAQQINDASQQSLIDLVSQQIATERYTIGKTQDVSTGTAKRYSLEIVLNATLSKAQIAKVVRDVTEAGKTNGYCRNDIVKSFWGKSEAHVVWTFVYLSADDMRLRNHVCRSLWIDPDLPETARPHSLKGETVGENLTIDWSKMVHELAAHFSKHTNSKADYMPLAQSLFEQLKSAHSNFEELFQSVPKSKRRLENAVARHRREIQKLSEKFHAVAAPYECAEFDQRLEMLETSIDNFCLYWTKSGKDTWPDLTKRIWLAKQQLDSASKEITQVEYELKKIR